MPVYYNMVWMCHNSLKQPPTDGHLDFLLVISRKPTGLSKYMKYNWLVFKDLDMLLTVLKNNILH